MSTREAITFPIYRGDFMPRGKSFDFRAYWRLANHLASRPLPPEPPPVRIGFRISAETITALDAFAENSILVIHSAPGSDHRVVIDRKGRPARTPFVWALDPKL